MAWGGEPVQPFQIPFQIFRLWGVLCSIYNFSTNINLYAGFFIVVYLLVFFCHWFEQAEIHG